MAAQSAAQIREETPPPRRRPGAEAERALQQQAWSAQPGSNDWTESPLTRPKDFIEANATKDKILLSPQARAPGAKAREALMPQKVPEEVCFSSPKPERGQTPGSASDMAVEGALFLSPSPLKENRNSLQAHAMRGTPRTPLVTPSKLGTVPEDVLATLEEAKSSPEPAWIVRSPERASNASAQDELFLKGLGNTPPPPGLEDVLGPCELPQPSVVSTFIQFSSPIKSTWDGQPLQQRSPPKTEPMSFAPAMAAAPDFSFFGNTSHDNCSLAMSHSPSPWDHEQIPFFPHSGVMPVAPTPPCFQLEQAPMLPCTEAAPEPPKQKGPVVRLADFLPETPAAPAPSLPSEQEQRQTAEAYWMAPPVSGSDTLSSFSSGAERSGGRWADVVDTTWQMGPTEQMQPPPQHMEQPQLQQQLQELQQMQQMQAQLQQMQLQQMQMSQMPSSLLQAPTAAAPPVQPQMPGQFLQQPLQPMQAPTMPGSSQLQAPQLPSQNATDNMFLQQLMQLHANQQMQPPTWPPMQPPASMAGEYVPAPPPQMAMEAAAPSVLCPSACHHAQVCRCGEVRLDSFAPAPAPAISSEQPVSSNAVSGNFITLSAAMFPEMGTASGSTDTGGRQ